MTYDTSSRAYLTRAKLNFDSGNSESLFYAAFELRCGVEARLKEYVVKASGNVSLFKLPWRTRNLAKILANSSNIHDKRFVFFFVHPKTKERHDVIYNPVSGNLQKTVQALGNYLHSVDQNRVLKPLFFSEFRQLVKYGIEELELATSGTLIAPPVTSSGNISFKFEKNRMPSLFQDPEITSYKFHYQVIKAPMPGNPFITVKPV